MCQTKRKRATLKLPSKRRRRRWRWWWKSPNPKENETKIVYRNHMWYTLIRAVFSLLRRLSIINVCVCRAGIYAALNSELSTRNGSKAIAGPHSRHIRAVLHWNYANEISTVCDMWGKHSIAYEWETLVKFAVSFQDKSKEMVRVVVGAATAAAAAICSKGQYT